MTLCGFPQLRPLELFGKGLVFTPRTYHSKYRMKKFFLGIAKEGRLKNRDFFDFFLKASIPSRRLGLEGMLIGSFLL